MIWNLSLGEETHEKFNFPDATHIASSGNETSGLNTANNVKEWRYGYSLGKKYTWSQWSKWVI